METIRSFTSLEQSKKLAEILPLESADMCWQQIYDENHMMSDHRIELIPYRFYSGLGFPAWSLVALLYVLPKDESIDCSISFGYYNGKGEYIEKWLCAFEKEGETTDDFIIETIDGDNPVDACYEMVLKLHESNLL